MKYLYVLVGVPGSGKSTWVENNETELDAVVVSSDTFVEKHAQELGLTYSEVFNDYMPTAIDLMLDQALDARGKYLNIVWDQTSVTRASRAKKTRMFPNYRKVAVVFETPPREVLEQRLNSRPGKVIPMEVVESMISNWQEVDDSEGFDLVMHIPYKSNT